MCANRVGKTYGEAAEVSYHATGQYPEWWIGHRFEKPPLIWACGVSADTTRDLVQAALLGEPETYPDSWGTGSIPYDCIDFTRKTIKRGAQTGTLASVSVDHVSGGRSIIVFKAYEQGQEKFMGKAVDYIWLDEEPPPKIFNQCITRTADTNGLVCMTFTPESGMTSTVNAFVNDLKDGQAVVQATWDDVDHLDEARKKQLLSVYTPAEREMRSRGIPVYGSGMVFTVLEDELVCDPIPLPNHWPRIAAIDFGWEHPTAVVWCAIDPETDTFYVYDTYRQNKTSIPQHCLNLRRRNRAIPMAYPHDGHQHDKGSGAQLAQQYRDEGIQMMNTHFTNPPAKDAKAKAKLSGKGNINVEPGIAAMLNRMETGNFKVFSTCFDWFEEYRTYHRKEGKIVPLIDDLMSATRYAHQSIRYAKVVTNNTMNKKIEYNNDGII